MGKPKHREILKNFVPRSPKALKALFHGLSLGEQQAINKLYISHLMANSLSADKYTLYEFYEENYLNPSPIMHTTPEGIVEATSEISTVFEKPLLKAYKNSEFSNPESESFLSYEIYKAVVDSSGMRPLPETDEKDLNDLSVELTAAQKRNVQLELHVTYNQLGAEVAHRRAAFSTVAGANTISPGEVILLSIRRQNAIVNALAARVEPIIENLPDPSSLRKPIDPLTGINIDDPLDLRYVQYLTDLDLTYMAFIAATAKGSRPHAMLELLLHQEKQLVASCKASLDLGIAERLLTQAENESQEIVAVLRRVFNSEQLDLRREQLTLLPVIVREAIEDFRAEKIKARDAVLNG